jgi:hypothetical protein
MKTFSEYVEAQEYRYKLPPATPGEAKMIRRKLEGAKKVAFPMQSGPFSMPGNPFNFNRITDADVEKMRMILAYLSGPSAGAGEVAALAQHLSPEEMQNFWGRLGHVDAAGLEMLAQKLAEKAAQKRGV